MNKLIELPETLSCYGQPEFQGVLKNELLVNKGKLPLEAFMQAGGWPDDENLEISIRAVEPRQHEVEIAVECFFKEKIPTFCAECSATEFVQGDLYIVLDIANNTAFVSCEKHLPEDEAIRSRTH